VANRSQSVAMVFVHVVCGEGPGCPNDLWLSDYGSGRLAQLAQRLVALGQLAQRFVALELRPGRGWANDLWLWNCGQAAAGPTICGSGIVDLTRLAWSNSCDSGIVARAQLAERFVALALWLWHRR
jgi:hypothetical protein